jgi:transketolase
VENKNNELKMLAKTIRRSVVEMAYYSHASHTGSALSIVDILTYLYFEYLNVKPDDPSFYQRDRLILSKGHASAALYATLAEKGYFSGAILSKYYCNGGILPGHLDKDSVPGIEISSGSLGHGLSIATGMAIALKNDNLSSRVVVLMGDGELNEGSVWEALMFIPVNKLSNIIVIIDKNNLQGFGNTDSILSLDSLPEKLKSFNWLVKEVNGHDFSDLRKTLSSSKDKPLVIIANTIKGKGVSFMENQFIWHYKSPNNEQLKKALRELE